MAIDEVELNARIAWLQMIQGVITRMSNYGFMLKGWGVTLVAALLALSVGEHPNPNLALLGLLPLSLFWWLDGWFLQTEERFRNLYKWAASRSAIEHEFSINPRQHGVDPVRSLIHTMFSITLSPFWCALGFVCLLVWQLVRHSVVTVILP